MSWLFHRLWSFPVTEQFSQFSLLPAPQTASRSGLPADIPNAVHLFTNASLRNHPFLPEQSLEAGR